MAEINFKRLRNNYKKGKTARNHYIEAEIKIRFLSASSTQICVLLLLLSPQQINYYGFIGVINR